MKEIERQIQWLSTDVFPSPENTKLQLLLIAANALTDELEGIKAELRRISDAIINSRKP